MAVRAANDRRRSSPRIKSHRPHQGKDRVYTWSLFFCFADSSLPRAATGQSSAIASLFALKTVINCFLNERHRPHQIRTQKRIQCPFCVLYCFLWVFLPFQSIKSLFCDKSSSSSESFCAFDGWALLLSLKL